MPAGLVEHDQGERTRLDGERGLVEMELHGRCVAASLYASDKFVSFSVHGTRFRKDGTLGKREDWFSIDFESNSGWGKPL